ncbi:hypothetical protein CPB83DRAFT_580491 [Crepidotus variabilis]|uniref:RING-type domain-containing protein n=1 Tax=Crepidotus variabilis TaxID=179855 RepID=A0A9P6JUR7_9AGAR|nr:hypothetical protein CPB83DRAFT_580491 [Crepidotus variabilis]
MDPEAIVAEAPPAPSNGLHFPYLNLNINPTYNISLNFSSLLSKIPGSRFLRRLRRSKGFSLFDETSHVQVGLGDGIVGLETMDVLGKAETVSMVEAWATQVGQMARAAEGVDQAQIQPPQLQAAAQTFMSEPLFPGPWEFFTSGYIFGLFIMAVLLHRMQNLIIPSPRSRPTRSRRAYRSSMHHHTDSRLSFPSLNTIWERIHSRILPVDFSKTATRLIIHIPSIYYLLRMLAIWTILVLQTCEVLPTLSALEQLQPSASSFWALPTSRAALGVVKWALKKDMAQICWSTFCAVCSAFLVEGFVKALHGLGTGVFPVAGFNGMSPFHLVSYAFLLHIYSSPLAHGFHPADNSPSRPDKHVTITISIALLQLSMFHILSISKRLSTHRLLPTTLSSILSLIHFHTTILMHLSNLPSTSPQVSPTSTIPTPTPSQSPASSPFEKRLSQRQLPSYIGANASYPLLNYVPNVIETILLGTIILTIGLNAIAQLLVRGRVDRLFSGLGLGGLSGEHDNNSLRGIIMNLPYEEDFIIVLLRAGIASLEATGLRGWANEVAPIRRVRIKSRRRRQLIPASTGRRGSEIKEDSYGRVSIGRLSVGDVAYGASSTASASSNMATISARNRRIVAGLAVLPPPPKITVTQRRGFANEVRHVDLGHSDSNGSSGRGPQASPWWRSLVTAWEFLAVLSGVLKGLCALLVDRVRRRAARAGVRRADQEDESEGVVEDVEMIDLEDERTLKEERKRDKEAELYQRFLRGEDISDEDEEPYDEDKFSPDQDSEIPTDDEIEESDGSPENRDAETLSLFSDLLRGGSKSRFSSPALPDAYTRTQSLGMSSELVLAHFIHGQSTSNVSVSPGPLTRRRWNALRASGDFVLQTSVQAPHHAGESATLAESDQYPFHPRRTPSIFEVDTRLEEEQDDTYEQRDAAIGLQHVCVICMLEAREIICWPCRCLAMCDGCRETLSSRSSASKHRCPCCRQIVEGYSKIYIP